MALASSLSSPFRFMLPSTLRNQIFALTPLSELQRWSLDPTAGQLFSVANCREILRQRYQLDRDQLVRYYDWLVEPIPLAGRIGFTSLRSEHGTTLLTPMQAVIKVAAYCGEVTIDSDFFLPSNVYALLLLRNYFACRPKAGDLFSTTAVADANGQDQKPINVKELLALLQLSYYPANLPQHLFYLRLWWHEMSLLADSKLEIQIMLREAIVADAKEIVALLASLRFFIPGYLFDLKLSREMALLLSADKKFREYNGYCDQLLGRSREPPVDNSYYQIGCWYAGNQDILLSSDILTSIYQMFFERFDLKNILALYQKVQTVPVTDMDQRPRFPSVITMQMFADIPKLREFVATHIPDPSLWKEQQLRIYAILLNEPISLAAINISVLDIVCASVVGHHQLKAMIAGHYHFQLQCVTVSDIVYSRPSYPNYATPVEVLNIFRLGQQLNVFDNIEASTSNLLFAGEQTLIPSSLDSMVAKNGAINVPANDVAVMKAPVISLREAVALRQKTQAESFTPKLTVFTFNTWRQLFPVNANNAAMEADEEENANEEEDENEETEEEYNERVEDSVARYLTNIQRINDDALARAGRLLNLAP